MSVVTPRLESRPLTVSAAGAVGVFLIHALLVLPFVLNPSAPSPRRPNATGAGATALLSSAEPDMTVVFVDEPTPRNDVSAKPPSVASRGETPPDLLLVVLSPDPSPLAATAKADETDGAQNDTGAAEAAEHAKLYGRYVGQIQARIERAWLRPRIEIGAPQFSCRVRIEQSRRGDLVRADLDHCSGAERWQQSLLSAIRTASPLPAPPDASVYADVLWLRFASAPFEEGSSAQGFEPEIRLAGTDRGTLASFRQFASGNHGGDDKGTSNVTHLTLIGNAADSPTADPPSADLPPQ